MADNEDAPTGDEVDEVELEDAELEAVRGGARHNIVMQNDSQSKR